MASLMPSGTVETFTGADGSAPNATNVTIQVNEGTGGGLSVQGNQLRVRTGATATNRTGFRLTGVSVADAEVVFTWTVTSTSYPVVMLRAGSNIDSGNGYLFTLAPLDVTLSRHVAYSGPELVTVTHGFTAGQVVRTRVAVFGQTLRCRTWLASASEPTATWQITYTDPTGSGGISAAGMIGWSHASASAGNKDFFIDNIDAKDTLTPTQATLFAAGSITMSGDEISQTRKKFAGSISPTNVLAVTRVVVRAFAGAITSSGLLKKVTPKFFAGSILSAGDEISQARKKLAGSITPAATIKRISQRRFAGSITPTGNGVVLFVGRVFGRPGLVVISLLQRAEVRIRHRKG